MTDCQAEQEGEVEALQSIYVDDEFIVLSPISYIININVEEDHHNSVAENRVRLECRFTYPEKYPDVPVEYSVVERSRKLTSMEENDDDDGDDDDDDDDDDDNDGERENDTDGAADDDEESADVLGERLMDLFSLFDQQIEENLGEAVVFTLVSSAKDWLDETVSDIRIERIRKEEEAELAKVLVVIVGTPCTEENFNAWKKNFDEEMRKEGRLGFVTLEEKKGTTGVQQFLADKSLAKSDLSIDDGAVITTSTSNDTADREAESC